MRLRIRFSKLGKVRFVGHRDVARIMERALRRCGVPVTYSEGFSPRLRMSFGLALPTCYESEAEYLDVPLNPDLVQDQTVITTSFSKVTFGGGGISFMATSGHSLELIKRVRTTMIICPDKLNQKRHVEFFKDSEGVKAHMLKHAELVRPKFEIAYSYLEKLDKSCGSFSRPTGGYFITYSTAKPIASQVVELCKEMGVLITPAGSTFPNNYDHFK